MTLHHLGPFVLDTRTLVLLREGEIVRIPMKTLEVLRVLLDRGNEVVTKDELLRAAWPDSIVEEANLTVHVALLRRTLGDAAPIETVPKRGYRLLAETPKASSETPAARKVREAVLRGRYFWNKLTRTSLEKAAAAFEEALAADPASGEGHSGLCDTYLMQGLFGFDRGREVFTRAGFHGEASARESPASAEAQASRAFSLLFDRFDFETAKRALAQARRLAPARAEPHLWSALFHAFRGDNVLAAAAATRALAIDPVSLKAVVGFGFHLYLKQPVDPDLSPFLNALDLEPDFAVAEWALGLAYDRLGRYAEAERAHRNAVLRSGGSPTMESNLARSMALAGRRAEANTLRERLAAEGLAPYRQATIQTALGENGQALASLERAWDLRDPWLVVLKVDPMLDAVRGERRFRSIEEEVFGG